MTVQAAYIRQRFKEIDDSLTKAVGWSEGNPELSAILASYLTVLISGIYEDCVEFMVKKRAGRSADPELESFVEGITSDTFRNPDTGNVIRLLGRFSQAYKDDFRNRTKSESRDALDSIIENKNWLAHGNTSQLKVTPADVRGFYSRSSELFEVLEDLLN